jgi:uncharacterized protein
LFRRAWEKLKLVWKLAKSERASPRQIFWAVFLGAFVGCTPAIGVHWAIAIGLATLFKLNRLFTWLGSRTANTVLLPFIVIAEVELAHRVRVGEWVTLDREHAVDQAKALLFDWCLGSIPVGITYAFLMGSIAFGLATYRDARKRRAEAASAEAPAKDDAPKAA